MATLDASTGLLPEGVSSGADWLGARWYAACTHPRHEKRIAEHLAQRSVEQFLPLYETVRRWKDRRVRLRLPLFPGYIFVRIALLDRLQVLQVPGVVRLVGFGDFPTPVSEDEILTLRKGLSAGLHVEPHPYLTVGRTVRITQGAFAGLKGVLVRKKGLNRVVISLSLIKSSIALEVDFCQVGPT